MDPQQLCSGVGHPRALLVSCDVTIASASPVTAVGPAPNPSNWGQWSELGPGHAWVLGTAPASLSSFPSPPLSFLPLSPPPPSSSQHPSTHLPRTEEASPGSQFKEEDTWGVEV